jgi:hypothetical protein
LSKSQKKRAQKKRSAQQRARIARANNQPLVEVVEVDSSNRSMASDLHKRSDDSV